MDAYIKNISYYLPEKIVTNDELAAEFPEWPADKIFHKVGIRERHVAAENETATDMAEQAALKLFASGTKREDIDFILFCTQSPDYKLPPSACILQNRLELSQKVGALDFDLGCSGYVYGLLLAKGLIVAGMAQNVLLLTSETYNKYIHSSDKGNRTIFGDGASATLVSINGRARIGNFAFGTDGKGANDLIVPNGGAKNSMGTANGIADKDIAHPDYIFMDGADVFAFTLRQVPALMHQVMEANGDSIEEIDKFVFHQANKYMLDFLKKKMHIPDEKMYYNLEHIGNTVSSTIPIALLDAWNTLDILPGNKVAIAGFGVGLSWAGTELYF
jgi:3-oxoacyl-[acyl-carrier-protein] synthase-3